MTWYGVWCVIITGLVIIAIGCYELTKVIEDEREDSEEERKRGDL